MIFLRLLVPYWIDIYDIKKFLQTSERFLLQYWDFGDSMKCRLFGCSWTMFKNVSHGLGGVLTEVLTEPGVVQIKR